MLRAISLSVLAWMLWLSLDRGRATRTASARSTDLPRALREWTRTGAAPEEIHTTLDSTLGPLERDWLAAIRAAGSRVTWNGAIPAIGVDVQPIATPRGGLSVLVAAPDGTNLVLSDEVGVLDSAVAVRGGARFAIPLVTGAIVVQAGASRARALLPSELRVRRVLVIGEAGWETKFTVAALEEDGWTVDAEMRVAPGVSVTQGSVGGMDTSRYSAVIALDSTAGPRTAQIARYVSAGGGLILLGEAGVAERSRASSCRRAGARAPAREAASDTGATTLQTLPAATLTRMRDDAVVLERRDGAIIAAARRHGGGRVLQMGYDDVWRWRMSGGETSTADHRAWWTGAVASVAYATIDSSRAALVHVETPRGVTRHAAADPAPVASLVGALGPASPAAAVQSEPPSTSSMSAWLFALLATSLLAEWASRRLRGAR